MIRALVPDDGGLDLQHLRRFAKYGDVPASIRSFFEIEKLKAVQDSLDAVDDQEAQDTAKVVKTPQDLFLVAGSINAISRTALIDALSATISNVVLFTACVPLLAPTSQEQATRWTTQYWPTVYKKSNPFGPHPSIVSRAEEEIRDDVPKWMDLAEKVAKKSNENGFGEPVGVVVVERRGGIARPIAVAGDARWLDWPRCGAGNVTAHAALRAIAMVAEGLRADDQEYSIDASRRQDDLLASVSLGISTSTGLEVDAKTHQIAGSANRTRELEEVVNEPAPHDQKEIADQHSRTARLEIFQDKPLLEIEAKSLRQSANGDGYLCYGLEIYCTHEPCVMCSMALVHSRFNKVVFARSMHKTGGLCADGELGQGLFWRKELNWTMLAWQWHDSIRAAEGSPPSHTGMHA